MFEVSESGQKPVNNQQERFAGSQWAGVVKECVLGALATKLIKPDDQIVSLYHRCLILIRLSCGAWKTSPEALQ
jgi:hypothetical protein